MYLPFSAIIIYCGKFIAGFTTAFTIKIGGKIIKYIDLVNKTLKATWVNSFELLNKQNNNDQLFRIKYA